MGGFGEGLGGAAEMWKFWGVDAGEADVDLRGFQVSMRAHVKVGRYMI